MHTKFAAAAIALPLLSISSIPFFATQARAERAGPAPRGTITLFSAGITAGSGPEDIVTGPDGNLWFTQQETDEIGRINPRTGAITEYLVPTANAGPFGITVGPDGNLWFTELAANRIGRINPWTGTITEFYAGISPGGKCQPSISTGAGPFGITAGPDGNLWFTEFCGDRIGRITRTGTITEFSTGLSPGVSCRPGIAPGTFPAWITAGPDRNLWFTEFCENKIGRINPKTGTITEFSTGLSADSGPDGITTGPDGNIWFAQEIGNEIGRINPWTGTITEFSTGISPSAGPIKITSGPDGKLWFTEDSGPGLAQVNPWTGTITELPALASGTFPVGITAGPDGNIWFTEYYGNVIGRLTLTEGGYR